MMIQVNYSSNAYLFDKSGVVADDDQSAAEVPQRGRPNSSNARQVLDYYINSSAINISDE